MRSHVSIPWILAAALLAVGALPEAAYGWGQTGHRTIGLVAEKHLEPAAAKAVVELLGPDSLAEVGTWADEIRSDPAWRHASTWHYVNFPKGGAYEPGENWPDCETMADGSDVIEAIACFTEVLGDREAPKKERAEALKWLAHLVGDLHQPLHTGFAEDRGGNDVKVQWFGEGSNLHSVWDSGMIDRENLSFTELAAFLDPPTAEKVRVWQASTPQDWAKESREYFEMVYDIGDGDLGYRYKYRAMPVVRHRLLQGGVRLAGVLNAALGGDGDDTGDDTGDED